MTLSMNKPMVLAVVGPTASGKTALGIELAKLYDGEVISADSMQIYKGMDIATAKPTVEEMQGIPHHLIGFLERDTTFSVADYVKLANDKIAEVISRGKQPVVVGGTGLYVSSLVDNIQFAEIKSSPAMRAELEAEAMECGGEAMLERLKGIDPETAVTLHANNLPRVIRALEVYALTGRKLSELKEESRAIPSPYRFTMIGLNFSDRALLYDRVNRRVDEMVKNGLIDEVRSVYESGILKTAHQAIGYKELIPYLRGERTAAECIEEIKLETRRYAKRQLTWFRKDDRIVWLETDKIYSMEKIIENCKKVIAKSILM